MGEWFNYEPLADPTRPPSHLVSPWTLLEWQAGDSFDLAGLACSLLLGVGYEAYVAVGYAPKQASSAGEHGGHWAAGLQRRLQLSPGCTA